MAAAVYGPSASASPSGYVQVPNSTYTLQDGETDLGAIAEHLADVLIHVSLTHEGDTAAAVAILETP